MQGLDLSYSADARLDQVTPTRTSWRDPRTRAIVAEALELAGDVVEGLRPEQLRGAVSGAERSVRGKVAARALVRALREAWRVGVLDLEGTPEELQARLQAGHYLARLWSPQTIREALRRLSEVCPGLFLRVDTWRYSVPLGELRGGGARLEQLGAWVDRIHALLHTRAECGSRVATLAPANFRSSAAPHSEPRKDHAGTLPVNPRSTSVALDRAVRDLRRLGAARQGQGGDRRTFVAACIGGDHGLQPEEWEPILVAYSETCEPPWRCVDLGRKLRSAVRNRKRPHGYKCGSGAHPPDPRRASADAHDPVRRDSPEIWNKASPLTAWRDDGHGWEGRAIRWLLSRGLDPAKLAALDLARVLPQGTYQRGAELRGEPWSRIGYNLVIATVNAAGELAGTRGRWVGRGEPDGPKEIVPWRAVVTGRVMANAAARKLLAGDLDVVRAVVGERRPIWIVEGGPDFLTMSQQTDDPVIGIVVGAWTPELAARIPTGARVCIATDPGAAGDALARGVVRHLAAAEIEIWRVRWGELDVNAAHLAGELGNATLERIGPAEAAPVVARPAEASPSSSPASCSPPPGGGRHERSSPGMVAAGAPQAMGEPKDLVTFEEISGATNISRTRFYQWIRAGILPRSSTRARRGQGRPIALWPARVIERIQECEALMAKNTPFENLPRWTGRPRTKPAQ